MSNESSIHIGLRYGEALQSKKDVLSSEISALKIAKHIRAYRYHRDNELDLKAGLGRRFRELRNLVINLQKVLPKPHMPEILRKEGYSEAGKKLEKTTKEKKATDYSTLEDQLWEIQRKLNDLQGKNF